MLEGKEKVRSVLIELGEDCKSVRELCEKFEERTGMKIGVGAVNKYLGDEHRMLVKKNRVFKNRRAKRHKKERV